MASTASSIRRLTREGESHKYNAPATNPMTMAAQDSTTEHPAVMATRPLRHPFMAYWRLNVISPVMHSRTMV